MVASTRAFHHQQRVAVGDLHALELDGPTVSLLPELSLTEEAGFCPVRPPTGAAHRLGRSPRRACSKPLAGEWRWKGLGLRLPKKGFARLSISFEKDAS